MKLMISNLQRYSIILACLLAVPAIGLPASLTVNGTCEAGTCPPVDTLSSGGSASENFSFVYTFANTDMYKLFGDFSTSNPVSGGTTIHIDATAVYLGSATGGSSANDLLTIDLLQDYNVPYSLDGNYTEHTDAFIGDGAAGDSSFSAQLSYNGNGLGELGTFTGPGTYSASSDADLLGMTNPLSADFNFAFDFGKGSVPGATISTVVPEPGETIPGAIVLFGTVLFAASRRFSAISR